MTRTCPGRLVRRRGRSLIDAHHRNLARRLVVHRPSCLSRFGHGQKGAAIRVHAGTRPVTTQVPWPDKSSWPTLTATAPYLRCPSSTAQTPSGRRLWTPDTTRSSFLAEEYQKKDVMMLIILMLARDSASSSHVPRLLISSHPLALPVKAGKVRTQLPL